MLARDSPQRIGERATAASESAFAFLAAHLRYPGRSRNPTQAPVSGAGLLRSGQRKRMSRRRSRANHVEWLAGGSVSRERIATALSGAEAAWVRCSLSAEANARWQAVRCSDWAAMRPNCGVADRTALAVGFALKPQRLGRGGYLLAPIGAKSPPKFEEFRSGFQKCSDFLGDAPPLNNCLVKEGGVKWIWEVVALLKNGM